MKLATWTRQSLQGTVLAFALFFSINTQATWYGPWSTPPHNYSYKTCTEVVWVIATHGIIGTDDRGEIKKTMELCTYYDSKGDIVGYSMTVVSP